MPINKRPEIFSIQKDVSTSIKKEKKVAVVAEVDLNIDVNVLINARDLQRCLLLGLLVIESDILYLSSVQNH